MLKASGKQALAYFCDALSGAPLARATVKLGERQHSGNEWVWRESVKETNQDGIALFDLSTAQPSDNLVAVAADDNRQAFSVGYRQGNYRDQQPWRIYAFTDRPAYRPNEVAQWKFIARKYQGSVYSTPANQTVEFEINDPRGAKVKEGKAKLNAFGSAWGSLELTASMPLGEYVVNFWDGRPVAAITSAAPRSSGWKNTSCRSFKSAFKRRKRMAEEDFSSGREGRSKHPGRLLLRRPGGQRDRRSSGLSKSFLSLVVSAARFPVVLRRPRAAILVRRRAAWPDHQTRDDQDRRHWQRDAHIRHAARRSAGLRVSRRGARHRHSRREIVGSGSVRVTRQRYYVYPRAKHNIYRPQDKVTVDLKALDANEQPMQVEGTVKVTRDTGMRSGSIRAAVK